MDEETINRIKELLSRDAEEEFFKPYYSIFKDNIAVISKDEAVFKLSNKFLLKAIGNILFTDIDIIKNVIKTMISVKGKKAIQILSVLRTNFNDKDIFLDILSCFDFPFTSLFVNMFQRKSYTFHDLIHHGTNEENPLNNILKFMGKDNSNHSPFNSKPKEENPVEKIIFSGNIEALKEWTKTHNVNDPLYGSCSYYRTPLLVAIEAKNLQMVKFLIEEKNAIPYETYDNINMALSWAIIYQSLDIVKYLVDEVEVFTNKNEESKCSALSLTVYNKSTEIAEYLMKTNKCDPFNNFAYDIDALECAIEMRKKDFIFLFFDKEKVKEKHFKKLSMLNDTEIINEIIEKVYKEDIHLKKDPNIIIQNYDNKFTYTNKFLIQFLNYDPNMCNSVERPIFLYYIYEKEYDFCKYLIEEKNIDFTLKDEDGHGAFFYATHPRCFDIDFIKYMASKLDSANGDRTLCNYGISAAIKENYTQMTKFLIEYSNFDINTTINDETLLEFAAEQTNIELTKYLIDKGAKLDVLKNKLYLGVKLNTDLNRYGKFVFDNYNIILSYLIPNEYVSNDPGDNLAQITYDFSNNDLEAFRKEINNIEINEKIINFVFSSEKIEFIKCLVDKLKENNKTFITLKKYLKMGDGLKLKYIKMAVEELGIDINEFNINDIINSIGKRQSDVAIYLIEKKNLNVNQFDADLNTNIISTASLIGDTKIVEYLIEHNTGKININQFLFSNPVFKLVVFNCNLPTIKSDDMLAQHNLFHNIIETGDIEIFKYINEHYKLDITKYGTDILCSGVVDFIEYFASLGNKISEEDIEKCLLNLLFKNKDAASKFLSSKTTLNENNFPAFKKIIEVYKYDINRIKCEKVNLLTCAIKKYPIALMNFLIDDCHADVNILNEDGSTPLWSAINTKEQEGKIMKLLESGADVNFIFNGKYFIDVFVPDNIDIIETIVTKYKAKGSNIPWKVAFYFLDKKKYELVKYFIEKCNFDIETNDSKGRTMLSEASYVYPYKFAGYLISKGAIVKNINPNALKIAAEKCNLDVVKLARETFKLDPKTINKYCLFTVLEKDYPDFYLFRYLVKSCQADIELKQNGKTPLSIVAVKGYFKFIKFLVENCNADTTEIPDEALFNAVKSNNIELVRFLVEVCGMDMHMRDKNNKTPLSKSKDEDIQAFFVLHKLFFEPGFKFSNAIDLQKFFNININESIYGKMIQYFKSRNKPEQSAEDLMYKEEETLEIANLPAINMEIKPINETQEIVKLPSVKNNIEKVNYRITQNIIEWLTMHKSRPGFEKSPKEQLTFAKNRKSFIPQNLAQKANSEENRKVSGFANMKMLERLNSEGNRKNSDATQMKMLERLNSEGNRKNSDATQMKILGKVNSEGKRNISDFVNTKVLGKVNSEGNRDISDAANRIMIGKVNSEQNRNINDSTHIKMFGKINSEQRNGNLH